MNDTNITRHCLIRAKERLNKNHKDVNRLVKLASVRGKDACDFTSSFEKNFMRKGYKKSSAMKVYNNVCYIFNENHKCVTLYRVPSWFLKKKHFNGKERIRNIKKYLRMNKLMFV